MVYIPIPTREAYQAIYTTIPTMGGIPGYIHLGIPTMGGIPGTYPHGTHREA